jgi:hypothetical protein
MSEKASETIRRLGLRKTNVNFELLQILVNWKCFPSKLLQFSHSDYVPEIYHAIGKACEGCTADAVIFRTVVNFILGHVQRNHAGERTPFPSTRDGLRNIPLLFPGWDTREWLTVRFSAQSGRIYPLPSRADSVLSEPRLNRILWFHE